MSNGTCWREEYGAVTAQDLVTGSNTRFIQISLFLIQTIKGFHHAKGETKDFNTVGVAQMPSHHPHFGSSRNELKTRTLKVPFPVNSGFFEITKRFCPLFSSIYTMVHITWNLWLLKPWDWIVKNKDYYDAENTHTDHVKLTFKRWIKTQNIKNFEKGQYLASVMPNSST